VKLHYVSGSRADFGLMQRCLAHIEQSGRHEFSLVVTGQHLLEHYGRSVADISMAGFDIIAEIPVHLSGSDGAEMGRAFATELAGFVNVWDRDRPDLVIVLGDRGEMLAATIAAVHLGIHVAHLHGGERSGTLDESLRHAISKLAHFHLPATEDSAQRLIHMGERPDVITVIGAPGLVELAGARSADKKEVARQFGFDARMPLSMVVFHPVVQEAGQAQQQIRALVETLERLGHNQIIMRPNSDFGGAAIDVYLDELSERKTVRICTHMIREQYLGVLASSDLLIGNSSSGIIESASLGARCVNLGSRQDNRPRNDNTVDCSDLRPDAIRIAVAQAMQLTGPFTNIYGEGDTDVRLLTFLDQLRLDKTLLDKRNAY
jgi:GDP/UDP-N,N'-diacetylbacillosamine 2-epimerase (hydrolysing)